MFFDRRRRVIKKGPLKHLIMTKIRRKIMSHKIIETTSHDYQPVNKYIDEKGD